MTSSLQPFLKLLCDKQMGDFLDICEAIKFPIALDKTFWGTTRLVFLGLLIDTVKHIVCLPVEKIEKAQELLMLFTETKGKKGDCPPIAAALWIPQFLV